MPDLRTKSNVTLMISNTIIISFQTQVYSLTELQMKEMTDTEGMDQIISGIEKTHKCFIKKSVQSEIIENPDRSLEFTHGRRNLTIQIACADICNETTDVIMHVTTENFGLGGVGSALWKAGGYSIIQECRALGQPAPFSIQYTNSGNLNVRQIAHVITPGESEEDLRKCLEAFFDDVSKRNITSISFSAIGAGLYGYTESESVAFIFDSLSKVSESRNSALSLVRIVILDQVQFINFKEATKARFSSEVASNSSQQSGKSVSPKLRFNVFRSKERVKIEEAIIKIYSDDVANIENAWEALKRIASQITNTKKKIISVDNDTFLTRDYENLGKLEKHFGFKFKKQNSASNIEVKKNTVDFSSLQEICNILEAAEDCDDRGKRTVLFTEIKFWFANRKSGQYCRNKVEQTVEVN